MDNNNNNSNNNSNNTAKRKRRLPSRTQPLPSCNHSTPNANVSTSHSKSQSTNRNLKSNENVHRGEEARHGKSRQDLFLNLLRRNKSNSNCKIKNDGGRRRVIRSIADLLPKDSASRTQTNTNHSIQIRNLERIHVRNKKKPILPFHSKSSSSSSSDRIKPPTNVTAASVSIASCMNANASISSSTSTSDTCTANDCPIDHAENVVNLPSSLQLSMKPSKKKRFANVPASIPACTFQTYDSVIPSPTSTSTIHTNVRTDDGPLSTSSDVVGTSVSTQVNANLSMKDDGSVSTHSKYLKDQRVTDATNNNIKQQKLTPPTKRNSAINDNFVPLNLKNTAGSCRGAAKRQKLKDKKKKMQEQPSNSIDNRQHSMRYRTLAHANVDPVDDYLDGTFHKHIVQCKGSTTTNAKSKSCSYPHCIRHNRRCKLHTVKKSGPNRGRKFYTCSLPRGEQCDYFVWQEDTLQAAATVASLSSNYTGRRVRAYTRIKFQDMNMKELRMECGKRGLHKVGKKVELLARLMVWVRDVIVKEGSDVCEEKKQQIDDELEVDEEEDNGSVESEDELEFINDNELSSLWNSSSSGSIIPLTLNDQPSSAVTTDTNMKTLLHQTLQTHFHHTSFRPGQEWAITRCLNHQHSLLVAPTGNGKSLCYALSALLLSSQSQSEHKGITIVVSPLLALIQDQMANLPPSISTASLSGPLSQSDVYSTLEDIIHDRLRILFVSPERLTSPSFARFIPRIRHLVRLICIDEVHCMSQWGHHFRPSYLRLAGVIKKLQPQSLLAMTATASQEVIQDVCRMLTIPKRAGGVLVLDSNRTNIQCHAVVCSSDEDRRSRFMKLIQKGGLLESGSLIVYVWRKRDAEVWMELINGTPGVRGGAVCYHGGMDACQRQKAQTAVSFIVFYYGYPMMD